MEALSRLKVPILKISFIISSVVIVFASIFPLKGGIENILTFLNQLTPFWQPEVNLRCCDRLLFQAKVNMFIYFNVKPTELSRFLSLNLEYWSTHKQIVD